ncbi:hypothetical protein BCT04_15590 [Vibrio breoganii]|uniref:DUF1439 domain-containing protein n=1 Tax=Vibrio breoganii TaxID=553239 RepID=UPI0002FFE946|nr:DUF1439 domain-containing protein [Vibrio breoganii]OEF88185.1 hypothetical protein B003_00110 [Vibrio breoganii 1C10]PMO63641.1 hypothetical protein BCT04_15590 [Vibrio breoganii]
MIKKWLQGCVVGLGLLVSGCASYSITEKEMTNYLQDNVSFKQSVGVENLLYAQVSVDDLEVRIGRADVDRVSVFASTLAKIQMWGNQNQTLDLDLEFSAVPEYDAQSGEVFLKSIRLEQFNEKGDQRLAPEIKQLLKPAVSMIGYGLSQQHVYKLDSNVVQEALIKSAEPSMAIKDNKLVIELFN